MRLWTTAGSSCSALQRCYCCSGISGHHAVSATCRRRLRLRARSQHLVTGSAASATFNYPSLPHLSRRHVDGAWLSARRRESGNQGRQRDWPRGYPHYETPRVMQTARQAFALLGVSAWDDWPVGVGSPSAGLRRWSWRHCSCCLPAILQHAWLYLNVDIVAASFVDADARGLSRSGSLACRRGSPRSCRGFRGAGSRQQVHAGTRDPAGAACRSDSTSRGAGDPAWAAALAAMVIAFLAVGALQPRRHSRLSQRRGLRGVSLRIRTCRFRRRARLGAAGLLPAAFPHGIRLRRISARPGRHRGHHTRELATAAVVLIFPLALLWILTGQRVHFTRNALAIQPFIAMFAAFGLVTLHGWLVGLARRRGWTSPRVSVPVLARGLILTMATVPFWRIWRTAQGSHRLAQRRTCLGREERAVQLGDRGPDRARLRPARPQVRSRQLKFVDLASARDPEALDALLADVAAPAAILVPRWGADRRSPGQKTADALNQLSGQWRVTASVRNQRRPRQLHVRHCLGRSRRSRLRYLSSGVRRSAFGISRSASAVLRSGSGGLGSPRPHSLAPGPASRVPGLATLGFFVLLAVLHTWPLAAAPRGSLASRQRRLSAQCLGRGLGGAHAASRSGAPVRRQYLLSRRG